MPCQLVAISWSFDSFSVRLAILDLKNIGRLSFVARIFMKALSSILCLVKSARFVPPGYESRVEVAELSKEEESKSQRKLIAKQPQKTIEMLSKKHPSTSYKNRM